MNHPLELLAWSGEAPTDAPDCPFEPLIGSWDVTARWFEDGAEVRHGSGEWHFGWILGGRAIQDVLFARGAPPEERGTTVRCYDASIAAWRVVWQMPAAGEFTGLVARPEGDEIVLDGAALDGSSLERWAFSEVSADRFRWKGESSTDGGATWQLDQEMNGTRMHG